MGEYNIDLRSRFQNAFGFVAQNAVANATDEFGMTNNGLVYRVDKMKEPEEKQKGTLSVDFITPREAVAKTAMGTPVFDQVTLKDEETGYVYTFAFPPMIDRSRQKNIITDPVVNGQNEVVEYIGKQGWNLTFRSILVDMENHEDPGEQVEELNRMFDIDRPLLVTSLLLNQLNISRLYFEKIDLSSSADFPDTQGFILEAKSYVPVQLIILDNVL